MKKIALVLAAALAAAACNTETPAVNNATEATYTQENANGQTTVTRENTREVQQEQN